jgi:hypothetical protein
MDLGLELFFRMVDAGFEIGVPANKITRRKIGRALRRESKYAYPVPMPANEKQMGRGKRQR